MAVTYRSSSTANSGSSTSTTLVLNPPSGVVPDDYLVVTIAYTGGTGVTITPATGFALVSTSNTSTTYGMQTFRRHANATESGTYTFTLSSAQYVAGICVAYNGVRVFGTGNTYFPQSGSTINDGSGSSTVATNVIPQSIPSYQVRWVASYNPSSVLTVTNPGSGLTTRADTSTTGGSFIQLALTDGLVLDKVLGTVSVPGVTLSGSSTNNKQSISTMRQDQTQVTLPSIDHASNSSANGTTTGTITVSGSMPNENVVAIFQINNASTGAVITSLTMPGVYWSLLASSHNPSNNTRTEVWTAVLPQTVTTYTATWTSNSAIIMRVNLIAFHASSPVRNYVTASSDSGSPSASIVTKSNNSLVYGFISDNNGFVSTVSPPNVLYYEFGLFGTGSVRMVQQPNTTAGTTITAGLTLSASAAWSMILFEVEPPKYTGQMFQVMP